MEHIDALEAVRRLTLERDALAERVEHLRRDVERNHDFIKRTCEERDALAKQLQQREDAFLMMQGVAHGRYDELERVRKERDALAEQVRALTADNQILTDTLGDTPCVPPSEICRTRHLQNCHACDRADCCDNITPSIQALRKERDALAEQVRRLEERLKWETDDKDRAWKAAFMFDAENYSLADQVKLLKERDAPQAPERRERPETDAETREGGNGAPEATTGQQAPILCACCRKPITRWLFCDDCEARAACQKGQQHPAPEATTEPQKWDGLIFGGCVVQLKEQYNGTQTCEGCKHWDASTEYEGGYHDCHRHAPTAGSYNPRWPRTTRMSQCGDWEGKA